MEQGRKRYNATFSKVFKSISTDKAATTSVNAVTESSSDVVTVESIIIHAVYVSHHFKVMTKWKIGTVCLQKMAP